MLTIQFNSKNEWWTSGKTFDRLFQAATDSGIIRPELEYWHHVANANGGFDLTNEEPSEADELLKALRDTAENELLKLKGVMPASEDESYRISLLKLLDGINKTVKDSK